MERRQGPKPVIRYRAPWVGRDDYVAWDYWLWDGKHMWIWNNVRIRWDISLYSSPEELTMITDDLEIIDHFPDYVPDQ